MRPTELLAQEHHTIGALLDRLEWAANTALSTGSLEITFLRSLIHALSVFLDCWHRQKEEELLFPLIEKRGVMAEVVRAALMMEEHDSGNADLRAMEVALHRPTGTSSLTWTTFSCRALAFVARMREHMRKEEEIVFPLAEASLREADRRELVQAFGDIERRNPFPGTREEIHRLIGNLPTGESGTQVTRDAACTAYEEHEDRRSGKEQERCTAIPDLRTLS